MTRDIRADTEALAVELETADRSMSNFEVEAAIRLSPWYETHGSADPIWNMFVGAIGGASGALSSAMALVPHVLPDAAPSIGMNVHRRHWHGYIQRLNADDAPETIGVGQSALYPHNALVAAILRAAVHETKP